MNEERKLILKMVEEGKITADEAVALLEAIDEKGSLGKSKETSEELWTRVEKQGEAFAQKMETAADKFAQSIDATIEGGFGEKVGRILAKLPFIITGETFEFVTEYKGRFAADILNIPIELKTANGSVNVEGWEEDYFQLVVTQRIRAKDRDSARAKMENLPLEPEETNLQELRINIPSMPDVNVSLRLFLPRRLRYTLQAGSTNGGINLGRIEGNTIQAHTSNGSIEIRQARADEIIGVTSNGSAKFDYVEANSIRQKTGNGSIKGSFLAKEMECISTNGSIKISLLTVLPESNLNLKTINGSVRCHLPRTSDYGVGVDVSTGVGRANVDVGNMQLDIKKSGSNRITGFTEDFNEKAKQLKIEARTSSGSISIVQEP